MSFRGSGMGCYYLGENVPQKDCVCRVWTFGRRLLYGSVANLLLEEALLEMRVWPGMVYSSPQLLHVLSVSWLPWQVHLSSTKNFLHILPALQPADHGLKAWAKIHLSSLKYGSLVLSPVTGNYLRYNICLNIHISYKKEENDNSQIYILGIYVNFLHELISAELALT